MAEVSSANTPADFGKSPEGIVSRWMRELELASKAEDQWRKDAATVVKRYRGESKREGDSQALKADSYNLLYANVQTVGPILYNSTPEPVVEQRFDTVDPVATESAEVLRRAIKYAVGCHDFDEVISLAVQDYQLPGRAVVAVQYVPTMGGPQGSATPSVGPSGDPSEEKTDEVLYEEVRFDLTPWQSFRRGPGRTWQDVPWIAYELDLPKSTCVRLFGEEIGNAIPYRSMQEGDDKGPKQEIDKETLFNRARVWQVWDKVERKVIWVSPDFPKQPLKTSDDEYNLGGFFNVPRPLYAVETSDSLVPVPEFKLYEALANEAEQIVNRMSRIMRMIRVRWAYDGSLPELETIMETEEGKGTAVKNADDWREKNGIAGAIWMWPLDTLVTTYQALAEQLDRIKGEVFEVLGIADIMRGSSDPSETMGAQAIKVRWGSLRTRRRQAEVQRFCRDLFNLAGELIAEKFAPQSLALMTGLEYFQTVQQKTQMQQIAAQFQQQPPSGGAPGAQTPSGPPAAPSPPPIPPEQMAKYQAMLGKPTWEEIVAFLRNDALRHFRIDIQTDSTIALQDAEDQGDYAKMMSGLAQTIGEIMPMVQQGVLPFDAAKTMLLSLVRKFRLGYEVENEFAQMKQPPPPDPTQSPDALKAQAKGQADVQVANAKAQASIQVEQARASADVQINAAEAEMKTQLAAHKAALDSQAKAIQALPQLLTAVIVQELKNVGALGVARVTAGLDAGQSLLDHELTLAEQQQSAELQPAPGPQ